MCSDYGNGQNKAVEQSEGWGGGGGLVIIDTCSA